eukprot:TRINITY_DN2408_c0_g2_i1.p1 TRINITY_DN2408_c0_g2~~TRINITY_DN2408_c0_g2_i1.p1  ORF type:complete len:511 (-),score=236.46 TRINITY_DN2408_c0_g2_i1:44-1423(-)
MANIEKIIKIAIENGLINSQQNQTFLNLKNDSTQVILFLNFDEIRSNSLNLISSFPPFFRHFFAVKANGLKAVLQEFKKFGIGCEVASLGELEQAIRSGFSKNEIIFDSPSKTTWEIIRALQQEIPFNIDNKQELEVVHSIIQELELIPKNKLPIIGLRINPQIGAGKIEAMSTATLTSKFGFPLNDTNSRTEIINYYERYSWLNAIHVHVGSQGCSFELQVCGINAIVKLAIEINSLIGKKQILHIDIGGGLSVNFDSDEIKPTFKDYEHVLQQNIPELFRLGSDSSWPESVSTEFGRSLIAKTGFIVARVEYNKIVGGKPIAIIQAGADLFVRTVYMPDKWPIRISVFNSKGCLKGYDENKNEIDNWIEQDVCGPCCFAGDMIAKSRRLPLIERNDFIVAHDTGGYYLSSFSYYNTRLPPLVVGFRENEQNQIQLFIIKKQPTIDNYLDCVFENLND